MILKIKRNSILLLSLIVFTACSGKQWEVKKQIAPKLAAIHTPETGQNDLLVSQLGNRLENSIHEGSTATFNELFDLDRFGKLATYTEYEDNKVKELKEGFNAGFSKGISSLPQKLIQTIEQGGFYDFLEYYYDIDSKSYRMLFRLFSEEEGINYHDFDLIKRGEKFYIQDIYIYLTGENLSETANKLYLMSLPKNIFEKIIDRDDSKDMNHMLKAVTSQRNQENETAVSHLNQIQGKLSHTKIYHVIKILAAANLDESIYIEAMSDMLEDFGDDPTSHLLSIDYYYMKGDYKKAMEAIDRLEEETGDTFLNLQRGNIAFESNDLKGAIFYFEKVLEEFPTYETPSFSLISCYSSLENYEQCVTVMDKILANEVYTSEDLIEYVESEEEDGTNSLISLVESNAYKTWKNKRSSP